MKNYLKEYEMEQYWDSFDCKIQCEEEHWDEWYEYAYDLDEMLENL